MTSPLLMSLPETARYLGRSPWWVRARVGEGEIPARQIGRRLFVSRPDLDRWLNGEAAPTDPAATLGTPSPRGARRGG